MQENRGCGCFDFGGDCCIWIILALIFFCCCGGGSGRGC